MPSPSSSTASARPAFSAAARGDAARRRPARAGRPKPGRRPPTPARDELVAAGGGRRHAAAGGAASLASDFTRPASISRASVASGEAPYRPVPAERARRSLAMSPLRRAADNLVNLLVLGGVIATFLTPVGGIALAVGLGLSLVTSLPEWAAPQNGPWRRAAALCSGVTIALALGSVVSVVMVGTGPVGWTLSGLASAAALTRLGCLMYEHRDLGLGGALRAGLYDLLGLKQPRRTAGQD